MIVDKFTPTETEIMILDDKCICHDGNLPKDMEFHRQLSDAAHRDIDVKRLFVLLQDHIQDTDTVETCIYKCKEILSPNLFKLIKDWMVDDGN